MFAKQQAVSALNKAREEYNAQLQKGKEMGLDEAAQAEPVRRSEMDTHDMEGTKTVHATAPKTQCGPKEYSKAFQIPGAACETSVSDVLSPKQFQDSITPPPHRVHRLSVPQKSIKKRQVQGKGVKMSAFKSIWKTHRPWLELRTVEQGDHEHVVRKSK